jgi:membrane protease YdiL (CAAX protease family)
MALDRRVAGTRLHLLAGEARQALIGARAGRAGVLRLARPSPAVLVVPWRYRDILRVATYTILAMSAMVVCLLCVCLLVAVGCALAETFSLVGAGTFAQLAAAVAPYGVAMANALTVAACGVALLYNVRTTILKQYAIPWSSLGLTRCERRFMGRALLLFLPITALGALVARLGQSLAGANEHDLAAAFLANGVAARPVNVLLISLVLVVIAPVAEEVFFRGLLFRSLRARLGFLPAASLSAGPWVLLHGAPLEIPWLLAMGLVYAYLAERSRSLYPAIILHSLTNALAATALIVALYGG